MTDRVVAWICDKEWIETYNNLFYGNVADQYDSLSIINVWRVRFAGRIPVAIDATSRLLEAWLEAKQISKDAQRQLLSAAITQFVGLITEHGLKGNTRKPIHEIGEDLGVPEWLINLRHEMAHGPLPTLSMLEKAVLFGLDWLKDNHWDVQYKIMMNNSKLVSTEEDIESVDKTITELLSNYFTASLQKVVKGTIRKKRQNENNFLKKIECYLQTENKVRRFCFILINKLYLTSFPRDLVDKSFDDKEVKSKYFLYWITLFKFIKSQNELLYFLVLIIKELQYPSCNFNSQGVLTAWMEYILIDLKNDDYVPQQDLEIYSWKSIISCLFLDFKNKFVANNILKTLQECVPALFSYPSVSILTEPNNVVRTSSTSNHVVAKTFTVDDVLQAVNNFMFIPSQEKYNIADSQWKVYDGYRSNCLIGLMPGQTIESLFCLAATEQDQSDACVIDCTKEYNTKKLETMPDPDIDQLQTTTCGLDKFVEKDWLNLSEALNSEL